MFCKKCGTTVPDTAKFCDNCGAPQIRPDTQAIPSHTEATTTPEPGTSKSQRYVVIGIMGIVALVLIAAVFYYYVMLGAGFFAAQTAQETVYKGATPQSTVTQKAQETVYKGVEQATSNIQMIGNVYGLSSSPSAGIDEIKFTIGLKPGAPPVDVSHMQIVFSTPAAPPQILVWGDTPDTGYFTAKENGVNPGVQVMEAQTQTEIDFKVTAVPKNTRITIELRPSVGASLPFSKTTPATVQKTNVLY